MTGRIIGFGLLALVVLFGLGWAVEGNDFFMYKFFAPKQENVRREVFENTKSYKTGMIQELENMQAQYATADSAGKKTLAPIIIHRAAGIDEDKLTADLRSFIGKLKDEQNK